MRRVVWGKCADRTRPPGPRGVASRQFVPRPSESCRKLASLVPCASDCGLNEWRVTLRVELNRLHNLAQVIGHGDGAVGKARAANAATAEHFVELPLIGRVISD